MRNSSFILAVTVLAVASHVPSMVAGDDTPSNSDHSSSDGQTTNCTHYYPDSVRVPLNTSNATICNDLTSRVCSKCTGVTVATNCTKNDRFTGPFSTQSCTIAFGHGTAMYQICQNEQGSFDCYGQSSGVATCSGCVDKNQTSGTSGAAPPSPSSGANPAGNTPTTGASPAPTNGAPGNATGSTGSGTTSDASRMPFVGQLIIAAGLITMGLSLI